MLQLHLSDQNFIAYNAAYIRGLTVGISYMREK